MNVPLLAFGLFITFIAFVHGGSVKRTLSTVRDTLAKESATTIASGIGAIAYCSWVVYLVVY